MDDSICPKVTVITMVYNSEKYLIECIQSILDQSFNDFEFLIIDDASSDNSSKIINSFSDNRIRFIKNAVNEGIALSRNKTLKLARGEYVAILDSDDIAEKDRLKIQVKYLDNNPDIVLLGSDYLVIDDNNVLSNFRAPTNPLEIKWKLLFSNCIAQSTVMFRKDLALKIGGYDEKMVIGEDFDLWIRLAAAGKVKQLDQPLTRLRYHRTNNTPQVPDKLKYHYVQIVMKSVMLQCHISIPFEVARFLYGGYPDSHVNGYTIIASHEVINECLLYFLKNFKINTFERNCLRKFAVEDLLRIACLNDKSFLSIYGTLKCATRIKARYLINKWLFLLIITTFVPKSNIKILMGNKLYRKAVSKLNIS